jgi:hypothetical protein
MTMIFAKGGSKMRYTAVFAAASIVRAHGSSIALLRAETSAGALSLMKVVTESARAWPVLDIALGFFIVKDVMRMTAWAVRKLIGCCRSQNPPVANEGWHEMSLFFTPAGDCWHANRECHGLKQSSGRVSKRRRCKYCTSSWTEMSKKLIEAESKKMG